MKYLIPMDSSEASLMPIAHIGTAVRRGASVEALLVHVQPRLNRHISRFTRKASAALLQRGLQQSARMRNTPCAVSPSTPFFSASLK